MRASGGTAFAFKQALVAGGRQRPAARVVVSRDGGSPADPDQAEWPLAHIARAATIQMARVIDRLSPPTVATTTVDESRFREPPKHQADGFLARTTRRLT